MSNLSLNDQFIHLHIKMTELSQMESNERLSDKEDNISFHCHMLRENIERRIRNAFIECENDISNFVRLVKDIRKDADDKETD